ncbi:hypothetical protein CDD83_9391 [Cordyceps sp. RAO-2017]|nr:hypothetical protein CDD83_9391 [Cordyceps sp. RAO-2017]
MLPTLLCDDSRQAVTNDPCCLFVEELVAAHPGAKVILAVRPREEWPHSKQNFIPNILPHPLLFGWRVHGSVSGTPPSYGLCPIARTPAIQANGPFGSPRRV